MTCITNNVIDNEYSTTDLNDGKRNRLIDRQESTASSGCSSSSSLSPEGHNIDERPVAGSRRNIDLSPPDRQKISFEEISPLTLSPRVNVITTTTGNASSSSNKSTFNHSLSYKISTPPSLEKKVRADKTFSRSTSSGSDSQSDDNDYRRNLYNESIAGASFRRSNKSFHRLNSNK